MFHPHEDNQGFMGLCKSVLSAMCLEDLENANDHAEIAPSRLLFVIFKDRKSRKFGEIGARQQHVLSFAIKSQMTSPFRR